MIEKYKEINSFDSITRFRMINRFIVTIGLFLLLPIAVDMKGEYLATWVISMLLILETISVKLHGYLVNRFDISELYKLGMGVHVGLIAILSTYFIDPTLFVVLVSLFSIIEVAIFGAFSIGLDVYQTRYFPDDVQSFKVLRNSVVADATLIGLTLSALITFFSTVGVAIIFVLIYHITFSFYFYMNWNYIRDNMMRGEVDVV